MQTITNALIQTPDGFEQTNVGVFDGVIQFVGGDVRGEVIDAAGKLLSPGYVDGHTHLIYMGDRAFELDLKLQGKDYLEILAAGGGIQHTVGKTREASSHQLAAAAMPRLLRMQQAGTVALDAKTGYALDKDGELRMLEAANQLSMNMNVPMRHTFLGAHAIPEGKTADQYMDDILDVIFPAVQKQGIATCVDIFVEEGVFTPEHGERLFEAAKKANMDTVLHADEIVNTQGAELAAKAGCVSADHLLRVSEEGIDAMAAAGTMATLMPSVPMTLMRPEWTPARALLDAGIEVALATDHNPNNPVTDMQFIAQLACYFMQMTPEEALKGVTQNGAKALGMEQFGRIEKGMAAPLLLHDATSVAHWVYEPGRNTCIQQIS